MVLLADKWVQQAKARKYRLQISDQIGFETASPTLSVICKNWGIPRSGQKFMGWEHSSEPLHGEYMFKGADAHQWGCFSPCGLHAHVGWIGGFDRCYGSGKLGLLKAASSIRPFSCPAFSIRRCFSEIRGCILRLHCREPQRATASPGEALLAAWRPAILPLPGSIRQPRGRRIRTVAICAGIGTAPHAPLPPFLSLLRSRVGASRVHSPARSVR